MPSEARLKKYRKIKEGPKKLNFGASKPGVGGARAPGPPWICTCDCKAFFYACVLKNKAPFFYHKKCNLKSSDFLDESLKTFLSCEGIYNEMICLKTS